MDITHVVKLALLEELAAASGWQHASAARHMLNSKRCLCRRLLASPLLQVRQRPRMQHRGMPELIEEVGGEGQLGVEGALAEKELLHLVEARQLRQRRLGQLRGALG